MRGSAEPSPRSFWLHPAFQRDSLSQPLTESLNLMEDTNSGKNIILNQLIIMPNINEDGLHIEFDGFTA